MKQKTECPFCREEINASDLKKHSKQLDKLLKEEAKRVVEDDVTVNKPPEEEQKE